MEGLYIALATGIGGTIAGLIPVMGIVIVVCIRRRRSANDKLPDNPNQQGTVEGEMILQCGSMLTNMEFLMKHAQTQSRKMWQSFQLKRKQFNSNIASLHQKCTPQIQTKDKDFDISVRNVNRVSDKSVRISSRKRKQKQLYPIENYSYCSTVRCDVEDASSSQPSPAKITKKLCSSNIFADNVVTESNGPILTSFTALEHDV